MQSADLCRIWWVSNQIHLLLKNAKGRGFKAAPQKRALLVGVIDSCLELIDKALCIYFAECQCRNCCREFG